jgi:serine/threonine protein kinase
MHNKNCLFSCLVISPAGRTTKEFCSVKEMLTALCNAFKAHRSLFAKAKILHRDISQNNITITDPKPADGCTCMLIDLDLAIVGGERTSVRHQTGTMEFMAIDVLRGVEHTYRHDLESFVLLRSVVDLRSSRVGKRVSLQLETPT